MDLLEEKKMKEKMIAISFNNFISQIYETSKTTSQQFLKIEIMLLPRGNQMAKIQETGQCDQKCSTSMNLSRKFTIHELWHAASRFQNWSKTGHFSGELGDRKIPEHGQCEKNGSTWPKWTCFVNSCYFKNMDLVWIVSGWTFSLSFFCIMLKDLVPFWEIFW